MLALDWKRGFSLKWFFVSMGVMMFCAYMTQMDSVAEILRSDSILASGWTVRFLSDTLTGDTMQFVLPVLCTAPFSSAFIDEYKSGMVRYTLGRVDKKTYIRSKAATAILSGGLWLTAGACMVMISAGIIFLPMEDGGTEFFSNGQAQLMLSEILCHYFLFGAMGSVTGLWASTAVNNRYMAWMAPFMSEYLLIILYERYYNGTLLFYPKEWLNPSEVWASCPWGYYLWMFCMIAAAVFLFQKSAYKRLSYL